MDAIALEAVLTRIEKRLRLIELLLRSKRQRQSVKARSAQNRPRSIRPPCAHLGKIIDKAECNKCGSTNSKISLNVYECSEFGRATVGRRADSVAGCCVNCPKYQPR